MKNAVGKQGYAYYGQCENGEFSPFNEKIWCLFCFVVYQIYAMKQGKPLG